MAIDKKNVEELSVVLGRMRELVWRLKADPEPDQFVELLRELGGLFNEAEHRLRHLDG